MPTPTRGRTADPVWMAVGTLVIGLSGYGFLSLIGHGRLDDVTLAAAYGDGQLPAESMGTHCGDELLTTQRRASAAATVDVRDTAVTE